MSHGDLPSAHQIEGLFEPDHTLLRLDNVGAALFGSMFRL